MSREENSLGEIESRRERWWWDGRESSRARGVWSSYRQKFFYRSDGHDSATAPMWSLIWAFASDNLILFYIGVHGEILQTEQVCIPRKNWAITQVARLIASLVALSCARQDDEHPGRATVVVISLPSPSRHHRLRSDIAGSSQMWAW
jgi:hypothetical protein